MNGVQDYRRGIWKVPSSSNFFIKMEVLCERISAKLLVILLRRISVSSAFLVAPMFRNGRFPTIVTVSIRNCHATLFFLALCGQYIAKQDDKSYLYFVQHISGGQL